ncbi:MAG: DUF1822 family protein [Fischerella sp. CENA71]|nr:DUF1822 family protein [Fischerella sp. CENA71]
MPNLTSSQDLRLLLPETVWLEPEHFLFANQTSSQKMTNASDSWQVYLNTLALLAFEVWLRDRLPDQVISLDISANATAGNLKVGEYKFCAIATEHLLDEIVNIPQELIEQPQLVAHFFVLLEVLEEEEEVVIRGFLPYKQLIEIKSNLELPVSDGFYQLPLSIFDLEPNHLLFYHHYVQTSEFAVTVTDSQVNQVNENLSKNLHSTTIKLSQWLQGVIDEGWQIIDSLANPELSLDFSTRNVEQGIKRAKIIDLGIDLGDKKFALLINIFPEIDAENQDKFSVLAQLYPMNGERFLPQDLKLTLLSKAGKILQEVTARIQDNYIQLKLFKGEQGKKFSIQISLRDISVKENFEL